MWAATSRFLLSQKNHSLNITRASPYFGVEIFESICIKNILKISGNIELSRPSSIFCFLEAVQKAVWNYWAEQAFSKVVIKGWDLCAFPKEK